MTIRAIQKELGSFSKKGRILPSLGNRYNGFLGIEIMNEVGQVYTYVLRINTINGGNMYFWEGLDSYKGAVTTRRQTDEIDIIYAQTLASKYNADKIIEDILPKCLEDISKLAPYYGTLLDDVNWIKSMEEDDSLAVGFDPLVRNFNLYYNPKFMLMGAIVQYMYYDGDYANFEECLNYMVKYYLMHEMSHITRLHLQNTLNSLDNVSPEDSNEIGDSFINLTIPKMLKGSRHSLPVIGITDEMFKTGSFNSGCKTIRKFKTILSSFCSDLFGDSQGAVKFDRLTEIPLSGERVLLKINIMKNPNNYECTNSTMFIKAIDNLYKALLSEDTSQNDFNNSNEPQGEGEQLQNQTKRKKQSNSSSGGSEGSKSSDGEQGGGSGGKGEGKPQDNKSDGSGDKGDKTDDKNKGKNLPNSSGKSDEISKSIDNINKQSEMNNGVKQKSEKKAKSDGDTGEPEKPSEKELKAAKDAIEKAVRKAIKEENKDESPTRGKPSIADQIGGPKELDKLGLILDLSSTKSKWKVKLRNALMKAIGIKEVYNPNLPNARLEGQLGREEEVPNAKSILILMDCSGSMGPDKFIAALREITTMVKISPSLKRCAVHVIYWGSPDKQIYKRYKLNPKLVEQMRADAKNCGSTSLAPAVEFAMTKVKRPDVCLICTDGELFDNRVPSSVSTYLTRMREKLIWVLTPNAHPTEVMNQFDSRWMQKSIRPDKVR